MLRVRKLGWSLLVLVGLLGTSSIANAGCASCGNDRDDAVTLNTQAGNHRSQSNIDITVIENLIQAAELCELDHGGSSDYVDFLGCITDANAFLAVADTRLAEAGVLITEGYDLWIAGDLLCDGHGGANCDNAQAKYITSEGKSRSAEIKCDDADLGINLAGTAVDFAIALLYAEYCDCW